MADEIKRSYQPSYEATTAYSRRAAESRSRSKTPDFKDRTADELLDEVASRGYRVSYLHDSIQILQESADSCDIQDVLTHTKEVSRAIVQLVQDTWLNPPTGTRSQSQLGDDRSVMYALDHKLTAETLATLKAKQCKCG